MDIQELLSGFAVAIGIGLLIGLGRGWRTRKADPGPRAAVIRTFAITGLLGGTTGALVSALGGAGKPGGSSVRGRERNGQKVAIGAVVGRGWLALDIAIMAAACMVCWRGGGLVDIRMVARVNGALTIRRRRRKAASMRELGIKLGLCSNAF